MDTMTIIINAAPYGIEKPWNALRKDSALKCKKGGAR